MLLKKHTESGLALASWNGDDYDYGGGDVRGGCWSANASESDVRES